MTSEEKQIFLEKLLEKQVKLKEELVSLEEMAQPISPENSIGRVSRMDAMQNKSVAEYALRQNQDRLRAIDFWLTRKDTADFGRCVACKQEIMFKRLLYMPYNLKCMHCAR